MTARTSNPFASPDATDGSFDQIRISSKATFFLKRVLPIVAFAMPTMLVAVSAWTFHDLPNLTDRLVLCVIFSFVFTGQALFFYAIFRYTIFDLADAAFDTGDAITIRNRGIDTEVLLTDIALVKYNGFLSPSRITIVPKSTSRLPKAFVFTPTARPLAFFDHPTAQMLRMKVNAANRALMNESINSPSRG